ncbi:MAG TPA: hypothetical protein PLF56_05345 [Micropruina sp.]|nr:hypothetical protein [Micropruina sp.]
MQSLIDHALDAANDSLAEAFLDSRRVFWVGNSDDPSAIAAECSEAARERVTLADASADAFGTLLALNRTLAGRVEIRLVLYSVGRDALAFVVLPAAEWAQLDDDIGDALAQVVWELNDDLDPFGQLQGTDVIDPYHELLAENPGRYGECLARALADPASAGGEPHSDDADEVMPW